MPLCCERVEQELACTPVDGGYLALWNDTCTGHWRALEMVCDPQIRSVSDAVKCFMSSCGCVHGCGREGIHEQKMTRCQSRLHVACGCGPEDSVVDVCASNPGHRICT